MGILKLYDLGVFPYDVVDFSTSNLDCNFLYLQRQFMSTTTLISNKTPNGIVNFQGRLWKLLDCEWHLP